MAAGLPVVANPVGGQAQMVRHGVTGLLAHTPEDWCQAIEMLAGNPTLRRRLGRAGRAMVEQEYSVAAGAARWQMILDQLAGVQADVAARALVP
jgi:glycosyltransferase involved in cell wall biosynthesis